MTDTSELTEAPAAGAAQPDPDASAASAPRRRPVRRPSKPDMLLAAAVDRARAAILEVAAEAEVGEHLGAFPEAERLVTHRFAANVAGYAGWQWFATLARVPRGKDATVCEIGLLPSEASLLAPDWVPWAERVRPEDTATEETATDEVVPEAPDTETGDSPATDQAEDAEPDSAGGESPVA